MLKRKRVEVCFLQDEMDYGVSGLRLERLSGVKSSSQNSC
jgi:hypothetical protein